jgi:hypothetical protein
MKYRIVLAGRFLAADRRQTGAEKCATSTFRMGEAFRWLYRVGKDFYNAPLMDRWREPEQR